jgi:hypothetical protein
MLLTASPSPKLDAAQQQVVDRYLLYVRTLEKLYTTTDPAKVDMSAVATGEQFRRVVEIAIQMKGRRQFARGALHDDVRHDTVVISDNSASLTSCQDANDLRVYDRATGKAVNPNERFPKRIQRVTLRRENGIWMVAEAQNVGEC